MADRIKSVILLLTCCAPFIAAAEKSDGFTAVCKAIEVHRYDSQMIWDESIDRHWSTDEQCCHVTVVYTGGKTLKVGSADLPIVAATPEGYLVAIDVLSVGWEAGVWVYAISPELGELVATEAKSFGLTPALSARAIQYNCEFLEH